MAAGAELLPRCTFAPLPAPPLWITKWGPTLSVAPTEGLGLVGLHLTQSSLFI